MKHNAIKFMNHKIPSITISLFLLCLSAPARADELADKGRDILKKNQLSVVTVELVLKSKVSMAGFGQDNDSRSDATGTVVDPSGLTVLSLSETDPAGTLQAMLAGMSDEENKFKMETELSDVKLLLEDGTEVPAEVVLRDKDLDLAFIRPKAKPASAMTALDMGTGGKAEVLDQVVALNRLGSAAGRAYSASIHRIAAVVQRPRLFYVPDSGFGNTVLGSPAFTLDGKPLGVFVTRSLKGKGGGMNPFSFQPDNFVSTVIVPCSDILKAVKQVPAHAAAPAEDKDKDKDKKTDLK